MYNWFFTNVVFTRDNRTKQRFMTKIEIIFSLDVPLFNFRTFVAGQRGIRVNLRSLLSEWLM